MLAQGQQEYPFLVRPKAEVRMRHKLDLRAAEPVCHQGIRKAFDAGDSRLFVMGAYSAGGTLAIVLTNAGALKARGMYEAALVEGFVSCKTNNHRWETSEIQRMFKDGDRSKLLNQGSPLPGSGPFTVYRGVCSKGRTRWRRGMSWTLSLDVACKFALGLSQDPAVYEGRIEAKDIYCYYTERGEEEIIGRPRFVRRLKLSKQRMAAGQTRVLARQKKSRTRKC
jgi:hypothetical protein